MRDQMIGVAATGQMAVGLVEDCELVAPLRIYPPVPEDGGDPDFEPEGIHNMPMETIVESMAQVIQDLCEGHGAHPSVVGVGFPGIIRSGVVVESPNLKQAKGARLAETLGAALAGRGMHVAVSVYNDADAAAAGLAATRGQLEKLIRVWTLGHGIGFGRYPHSQGPWEGGHSVVSLDPKESFCGCGGKGHLEGIMGHRAMRLRFLDLEPEEIFEAAHEGEARCVEFEQLWHRALAAATATNVHMEGPGKFYITGASARFIKVNQLTQYFHEMVTMTPLQGSVFEVVPTSTEIAVVGAAINASRATKGQLEQ
jgi:predicted NBD/HSP70 family sugar kinase